MSLINWLRTASVTDTAKSSSDQPEQTSTATGPVDLVADVGGYPALEAKSVDVCTTRPICTTHHQVLTVSLREKKIKL